ncbi:MAG: large repetitive protein, partial [Thermoleophilales bacterium]|nr:large repetitive protein [Thermoleophilales bacterium]
SFPSTSVPYLTTTSGARAAAAPGQMLHVSGQVDAAGAAITEVGPAVHSAPAPARSDYALVVSDAGGATLSSTPMSAAASHVDGGGALLALAADVPASAQAARVTIVSGGAAIASRTRSAHPPTLRVTAPASGTTVGASGVVRWVAKDADRDALAATVAYSLDDGKHWRTIYSGPSAGSAKLPGAYFSASRRARVLVRVNDGFDERGARSGRFRARGVRPMVRLRSPAAGTKLLSSSTLVLEGEAFDDASQPLKGKRLVWFAGKRRLGTGGALSTAGLSPGRQRLRLVATDRTGRRRTATVIVGVAGVAPQLIELGGPKKVSRRARKVTLRLAVNTRSKLAANGRVFTVGRRVSQVTLPIRPGRKAVKLRLVLRAGAKRTTVALHIPRR